MKLFYMAEYCFKSGGTAANASVSLAVQPQAEQTVAGITIYLRQTHMMTLVRRSSILRS